MNADEITRRHLIENDLPEHILEPEMSSVSCPRIRRHTVEPSLVEILRVKKACHARRDMPANGLVHPEQHGYQTAFAYGMQFVLVRAHSRIDSGLILINHSEPRGPAHFEGIESEIRSPSGQCR